MIQPTTLNPRPNPRLNAGLVSGPRSGLDSTAPVPVGAGLEGCGAAGIETSKTGKSGGNAADSVRAVAVLPTVDVQMTPEAIIERLGTASRRGRLAGFEKGGQEGSLFEVLAFGAQFDGIVAAVAAPFAGGTRLTFSTRMKRRMPIIWCVILLATVWPGVELTDSFLANFEFARNWWPTWWWYMPLTVPFVPWGIWSPIKKSRAAISVSAVEMIEKVRQELTAAGV